MTSAQTYLPGENPRARRMRLDTAGILKRFFFCEKSLIIGQAGWLISIAPLGIKTTLPRIFWEDAMTAHALRERVFELRYPSRLMLIGEDTPLIDVFQEAANAPSAEAYLLVLARVLKPALLRAYRQYIEEGDGIADGPTLRFLRLAVWEKEEHIATLGRFAEELLSAAPERRSEAETWVTAIGERLARMGGVSLDEVLSGGAPVPLPGYKPFQLPDHTVRDPRFHPCRFYWPDVIVPDYPYGEGLSLQLRSAVSHINEVWAVDTAAIILHAFANTLDWEFIYDAARWTYDEARHCYMGYDRLRQWGFTEAEIPLGTYISDSAQGKSPIYLIGMLAYFETKNIGKKNQRAKAFAELNDHVSQHDMEFDWADETIHAHYGSKWIGALREAQPDSVPDFDTLRLRCDEYVASTVASATDSERADILAVAESMLAKATKVSIQ